MIERLQVIATHLLPFRLLLGLVAMLAFTVLMLSLLENPWLSDDALLIPAILCFTWSVTLLSLSGLFIHIPDKPAPGSSLQARLSYRFRSGVLGLLALMTLALCAAMVILTFELLRVGSVG